MTTSQDPRAKQLQRTTILFMHLHALLGMDVSDSVINAAADKDCTHDYSGALRTMLQQIKGQSQHTFDNLIREPTTPLTRDLREWWEEDCKRITAGRRMTSNRRNAGRRMGIK
jgi:hypothetical protein